MGMYYLEMVGYICTAIMIVITLLSFLGFSDFEFSGDVDVDVGDGLDSDSDTDEGSIFTFRNFIGFFAGFGLTTPMLDREGFSIIQSIGGGVLVGCVITFIFILIYNLSKKLEHEYVIDRNVIINQVYNLYIGIPKNGMGSIMVNIEGQYEELKCVLYDNSRSCKSGTQVRVIKYLEYNKVIVEPLNNETDLPPDPSGN